METVSQFATRIKTKYPDYKDIPDQELVTRIVSKHPEYKDVVDFGSAQQAQANPLTMGYGQPADLKSVVKTVLTPVAYVGSQIDRVTGVPLRAGISEVQKQREARGGRTEGLSKFIDPNEYGDIGTFAKTALRNVGNSPENVASSKDVMQGYGVPLTSLSQKLPGLFNETGEGLRLKKGGFFDPTAAGMAGLGLDFATPVPFGEALGLAKGLGVPTMKMAGKTTAKAAELGAKTAETALNVATGTQAGTKTLNAVKGGLSATQKGFSDLGKALESRYGAKLSKDAPGALEVMQRNGIDPKKANKSILFGPNSSASRIERSQAEGPLGQHIAEKHDELVGEIRSAIDADIKKIGGEARIPADASEAGEMIKSAYDKRVDEVFSHMTETYGSLASVKPGAKIPPEAMAALNKKLDDAEKYATDLAIDSFDATTEAQGKHLLEVIGKIRNRGDDYGGVIRGLQGLGRTTFKTKTPLGQVPPDIARLKKIYGDINEAVMAGTESNFGKEAADNLRANNATITEMFGDKALIPSMGDNLKDPAKLFTSLFVNGDATKLNALKKYLTPEEFKAARAAALNHMIKKNINHEIGFRETNNLIRDKEKSGLFKGMFEPGELDNTKHLLWLGDKVGPKFMSSSGSSAGEAFRQAALSDWIRPTKLLNKLEKAGDIAASKKQEKALSRAIGFTLGEPRKAAAKAPNKPTIMGFKAGDRPTSLAELVQSGYRFPRSKLSQVYSNQSREED
jgi:hypothetical protein